MIYPTVHRRLCPVGDARSAITPMADSTVGHYSYQRYEADGEPSSMYWSIAAVPQLHGACNRQFPVGYLVTDGSSIPSAFTIADGQSVPSIITVAERASISMIADDPNNLTNRLVSAIVNIALRGRLYDTYGALRYVIQ